MGRMSIRSLRMRRRGRALALFQRQSVREADVTEPVACPDALATFGSLSVFSDAYFDVCCEKTKR